MSKGRILAVDDERFFRVLYEDVLGAEGYSVTTAEDGARALALLEQNSFDLAILDVIMPGEDGVRVAERIKGRWPSVETLIITSLRDVKVAANAMQRGVSDFLTKPINPDELVGVVARLFGRCVAAQEHSRLLDENMYFLDSLGVYQRGLPILEELEIDAVGDAILDRLMAETSAQGGALWLPAEPAENDTDSLHLESVRGSVSPDRVGTEISWSGHPQALELVRGEPFIASDPDESAAEAEENQSRNPLYLPVAGEGTLLMLVKLQDKLGGSPFGPEDLRKVRMLAPLAATGLRNARAYSRLARRSLKDPETHAYDVDYFRNYLQAELLKSERFERRFSLVGLRFTNLTELRKSYQSKALRHHSDNLIRGVADAIRDIDLIGRSEKEEEFHVLLPETDYLGSVILQRRIGEAVKESNRRGAATFDVLLASVCYPRDGLSSKTLFNALDISLTRAQANLAMRGDFEDQTHWEMVSSLLASDEPPLAEKEHRGIRPEYASIRKGEFPETYFARLQQTILEEVERDPSVRGVAFLGVGDLDKQQPIFASPALDAKPALRVYALGAKGEAFETGEAPPQPENAWLSPLPVDDDQIRNYRFIVFLSEETAYAFYGQRIEGGLRAFHTADTRLVESFVFKLQQEYGVQFQL